MAEADDFQPAGDVTLFGAAPIGQYAAGDANFIGQLVEREKIVRIFHASRLKYSSASL